MPNCKLTVWSMSSTSSPSSTPLSHQHIRISSTSSSKMLAGCWIRRWKGRAGWLTSPNRARSSPLRNFGRVSAILQRNLIKGLSTMYASWRAIASPHDLIAYWLCDIVSQGKYRPLIGLMNPDKALYEIRLI